MPKFCVELNGDIEVEADTPEEAMKCAFEKLINDGPEQHLMADIADQWEEEKE